MSAADVRPLAGYTVGVTDHARGEEQAERLSSQGAHVVHGPVMETSRADDLDATLAATRAALAAPVDVTVLTTGIGVRSWFAAAETVGLDDALRRTLNRSRLLVRGSHARHVARAAGLDLDWTSPDETDAEEWRAAIAGRRVVVQRDRGAPPVGDLTGAADVVDAVIAPWHFPAEDRPAQRLLEATTRGQLDAVTFSGAGCVGHAFALSADPHALARALNGPVAVVAVDPGTAEALRDHGVRQVTEPERDRSETMVGALGRALGPRSRVLSFAGTTWRWQGTLLIDPAGEATELTPGEHRLLRALVARAPGVVAKEQLGDDGVDEHAVESAVARLRAKLGPLGPGLRTVRRRGYACDLAPRPAPALPIHG